MLQEDTIAWKKYIIIYQTILSNNTYWYNIEDNLFVLDITLYQKPIIFFLIIMSIGNLPRSPYNIACGVLVLPLEHILENLYVLFLYYQYH